MKHDGLTVPALCGALLLGGCQVQHTTVVEQASATQLSVGRPAAPAAAPPRQPGMAAMPSPCASPAGTGPFERLPRAVSSASVPLPPRAMPEHVSGCAGVRFRLGPDGAPTDVSVRAEYPLDYGFAGTARTAVLATRWPARDDAAWRYLVITMHPQAAPPS